jgi:SAM-dependent methyltransferase
MPSHGPSKAEYLLTNRAYWDEQAASFAERGRRAWAREPTWGIWQVPETQLRLLPQNIAGLDTIELGCGTAYISAWLARLGARPVGIDNSPAQLATARDLQREFGIEFPLHLGNAEATPFASASFDFAISEYGAAIWCDPYEWIPEAARLLKPGGQLVFLGNSTLMMLAAPELETEAASDRLLRPQRGMHRFEWSDTPCIEFHLSPGDWIRLLRANSFEIEDLIEVYPTEGSPTQCSLAPFAPLEWAQAWPCEEVWKVRKRS